MKVWFNRIHDSRRTLVEVQATEIHIGRDAANEVVLASPLVSKRHAVRRQTAAQKRRDQWLSGG